MKIRTFITLLMCIVMMTGSVSAGAVGDVKTVTLQIYQVKAVDECGKGLGELGADEISLGGIAVDATGTVRSKRLSFGQFGRDGRVKNFPSGRELVSFAVNGTQFPKLYQVALVLAETDPGGGFDEYLNNLTQRFRKLSGDKSASHTPPSLGSDRVVVTAFAPRAEQVLLPIAKDIAEEAAEEAAKMLKAELKKRWKDEIFPLKLEKLAIPRASFKFPGGTMTGQRKTVTFSGHNCRYQVVYSWSLN